MCAALVTIAGTLFTKNVRPTTHTTAQHRFRETQPTPSPTETAFVLVDALTVIEWACKGKGVAICVNEPREGEVKERMKTKQTLDICSDVCPGGYF